MKHGEPGATATRTMSFSLDDIRKDEFAEIDTDKDGKISLQEYQARQTAMLTRGFEVLDANSDKSLSEEEYARIVAPPMVKMNWTVPDGVDMPEPPKVDIPGMKEVSPRGDQGRVHPPGRQQGREAFPAGIPAGLLTFRAAKHITGRRQTVLAAPFTCL